MKQIEFTDGDRHIALAMFYPAALADNSADADRPALLHQSASPQGRRAGARASYPLVMLSHGRGSNPLQYAWFARDACRPEAISSPGSITIAPIAYDQTIAYLSNKIWQRPRDISLAIDFLLKDPRWGKRDRR